MKRLILKTLLLFSGLYSSACVFQVEDHSVLPLADQLLYVGVVTGGSFQLMSTSPADGASGVAVNSSISLSFNNRMAADCIKVNDADNSCSGSLQISSDEFATCVRMNPTVTPSADHTTFVASPMFPLVNATGYQMRVRGDVADLTENSLGADVVTTFNTGGSSPKKTFLTNSIFNGNLGGIAGADAKCMSDANYPGSGTYKALIVDGVNRIASISPNAGDGQVDWVLKPDTSYLRSDGATHIMNTGANALFVFGSLTNSPGAGISFISTGLVSDWTSSTEDCSNWASTAGNGRLGWGNRKDAQAIDAMGGLCNMTTKQLLCVEQ